MKYRILLFIGLSFLTSTNHAQTVTDYDGNVYDTIHIGTQVWLKQNLKVTHYNNGDQIPNVVNGTEWKNLSTGARCYYDNDSVQYEPTYGALYNWHAVNDNRKLCPTGWHVPSDAEFNIMEIFLDNTTDTITATWVGTDIGDKLKEIGSTHWLDNYIGETNLGTNSSGFGALPGGSRNYLGSLGIPGQYEEMGYYGYWWSSTIYDYENSKSWHRILASDKSKIGKYAYEMEVGYSVRCMCDAAITTSMQEINHYQDINIYPNPATNNIIIECANIQSVKMQIYNMIGECVLQKNMNNDTNEIDISSWSKGMYVIRLTGADWTEVSKLTKE